MGMVKDKMIGRLRAGEGRRGLFRRMADRVREEAGRQQTEQEDERAAPRGRTRRPVDEPLMMGGRRQRSLMKQRLGS